MSAITSSAPRELRSASLLRTLVQLGRTLLRHPALTRGVRRLGGHGRRLQITETVQLGEKRFVAILRVDGEQFLLSGSATGVSLLATLGKDPALTTTEPVVVTAPAKEPAPWPKPASFATVLATCNTDDLPILREGLA